MKEPTQEEILSFVRQLRSEAGCTQREVAECLHYSRANYTYIEEGKLRLSLIHIQCIAGFYGISSAVFFLPDLWGLSLSELRALDFTRVTAA